MGILGTRCYYPGRQSKVSKPPPPGSGGWNASVLPKNPRRGVIVGEFVETRQAALRHMEKAENAVSHIHPVIVKWKRLAAMES